jgi:predicted Zn-dependent protease
MNCTIWKSQDPPSRRLALAVWLMTGATWIAPTVVSAQAPFKLPFTDPSQMFEKMFGEDTEEDRKALEKIDVSPKDERELGQQILQSGLSSLKDSGIEIVSKGRDVEYVTSLVETLRPFMKNKDRYDTIRVLIGRSPRVDARSCPGGTLIFFDGLLDGAGSEAALAVIVGHELSHLDHGHQLLPIKRMKLMEKSLNKPQNFADFMQSGPAMTKLWARPFRPEDERDADRDGVAWAYAAGYDPREAVRLFQKKATKSETAPWSQFFRSHPCDHERTQAMLKQFKELQKAKPPAEPLFVGKENLKTRFSRQQEEDAKKEAIK